MRSYTSSPRKDRQEVLQPHQGGTGVTTQTEAAALLGTIPRRWIGKPDGVVQFEPGTRFIDPAQLPSGVGVTGKICLEGNRVIPYRGSSICKITNFDSFTAYNVSASGVTVTLNGDTLLVTSTNYVANPKVYINSEVFEFVISAPVTTVQGRVLGRQTIANARPTKMTAKKTGGRFVLGRPETTIRQATKVGEVQLHDFTAQNTFSQNVSFTPLTSPTTIAYSGQGTKEFTVKNAKTTKNDVSVISFNDADNIMVKGTGANVVIPGTPQKGLPQYPNGLPSYKPAFEGWRNNVANAAAPRWVVWMEADLGSGLPFYSLSGGFFSPGGMTPTNGLQRLQPVTASVVDSYVAMGSGWATNYHDGRLGGFAGLVAGLELDIYVSEPQEGLPAYPYGLPPYEPGTPDSSYVDKVKMDGSNFHYNSTSFESVVYPWNNYKSAESVAIAPTGSMALGSPRATDSLFEDGGSVIVQHSNNDTFVEQLIKSERRTPYPSFGASVAFSDDGNSLFVGAPGVNEVTHYKLNGNSFSQVSVIYPDVVNVSQMFGAAVVAFGDILAVAAGNQGTAGAISFFKKDSGGVYRFQSRFDITADSNCRLGTTLRMVSTSKIYASIKSSGLTGHYVVEITNPGTGWKMGRIFRDIEAPTENGFGTSFDISAAGDVMAIGAPGNKNTRGMIHLYVFFEDAWSFYATVVDPNGTVGDGFGSQFVLTADGKQLQILSESFAATQTLIYMD